MAGLAIDGVALTSAEGAHKFGGVYVHKRNLSKSLSDKGVRTFVLGPFFPNHLGETFNYNACSPLKPIDASEFSYNDGSVRMYRFERDNGHGSNGVTVESILYEPFLEKNRWAIRSAVHGKTGLEFGFDHDGTSDYFVDSILAYNVTLLRRSEDLLNEGKISLIHPHDTGESIYTAILSAQRGNPTVFTIHSTEKERAEACNGVPNQRIIAAEVKGSKVLDHVIAVSDYTKSKAVKLGYPSEKVRVIGNGVYLDQFNPRELAEMGEKARKELEERRGWKITDDTKVLVFVGRPCYIHTMSTEYIPTTWKGPEGGLAAVKKLKENGYDVKAIYIAASNKKEEGQRVVGYPHRYHTQDSAEGSLINLINFLGIGENVELINTYLDVRPYLSIATDIVPLSYEEDWGITFTEGLATCRKDGKKPIVWGAKGTGHDSQVTSNGNNFRGDGFVVVDEAVLLNVDKNAFVTADRFFNALKHLENSESEAKRLPINAAKKVEEFTWDKVAELTLEVYEEALHA